MHIVIGILNHSPFCELNCMLPACRPNYVTAARTTKKKMCRPAVWDTQDTPRHIVFSVSPYWIHVNSCDNKQANIWSLRSLIAQLPPTVTFWKFCRYSNQLRLYDLRFLSRQPLICDTVHFGTWVRTIWMDQPPPSANTEHVDNTLNIIHSVVIHIHQHMQIREIKSHTQACSPLHVSGIKSPYSDRTKYKV